MKVWLLGVAGKVHSVHTTLDGAMKLVDPEEEWTWDHIPGVDLHTSDFGGISWSVEGLELKGVHASETPRNGLGVPTIRTSKAVDEATLTAWMTNTFGRGTDPRTYRIAEAVHQKFYVFAKSTWGLEVEPVETVTTNYDGGSRVTRDAVEEVLNEGTVIADVQARLGHTVSSSAYEAIQALMVEFKVTRR